MNQIELYDNVSRGGELEFIYNDKNYSITHSDEGIHIMEQYNYETECVYKNAEDIGEYYIGDVKLKDVLDEIIITFSCF